MRKRSVLLVILLLVMLTVGIVNAYGNISVSSVPAGATIYWNGTSTGLVTPAIVESVPVGITHTILLRLTNYDDYSQSVTVTENATSPVSQTLVATASVPTISGISPTSATNGGSQDIVITGSSLSGSTVYLKKDGQTDIQGSTAGVSDSATSITRKFNLKSIAIGTWTLYLLNSDGKNTTTSFTVSNATAASVTSISPTSATTNTTVSVTIAGTSFTPASARIRLYQSGNYIGGTVNSGGSATQLTGSFNLDQATPATYTVCVLADGTDTSKVCGPNFIVYSSASAANGSIYFTSTPTGAVVYVDSVNKGNTPLTLSNVIPGSYTVKIQRASYLDWAERVTVTAANQTTVTAKMTAVDTSTTAPPVTTIVVTTATLPPRTTRTTIAATPWPTSTAAESPVEIFVIIGAVGLGIVLVRKP